MESQGNGKRAWLVGVIAQTWQRAYRHYDDAWRGVRAPIALCAALLWIGLAHATSYVYDANGRVVAVTQSNGNVAQYNYDALGNLQQVTNLSSGQLAIFTFLPSHGAADTQVTIEGQGFSTTLANDSVSFNGTAGIVLSATANSIVTQVPSGATSGPISVTVSGKTVTSAGSFTVDDTGVPPQITAVSPSVINIGSTVTVTGAQLYPITDGTTVSVGGTGVTPSAQSQSQLQIAPTSGGLVTVQTPFGQSTSTTPLIVLPSGFTPANVVSTGSTTPGGAPVTLNITSANQYGVVTFNANAGAWVSLQTSGLTPTSASITYWVYAPGGVLVEQGTESASSPSIHLPQLPVNGTYEAIFETNTASTQMTIAAVNDAMLTTSTAATMVTTVPSQSTRLLYQASAGQNLDFDVISSTTSPANSNITYTFYQPIDTEYAFGPNGTQYTSAYFAGSGIVNLRNIPLTGTYQIIISPTAGATTTTQVEMMPMAGGVQPTNGTSASYTTTVNNEQINLSFTATQGQNLELTLNNISITGSTSNALYFNVYNSAGANVGSSWCYESNPGPSCSVGLWNLAAGTYNVIVVPQSGTLSFNAVLLPDVVEPALTAGTPVSVALTAGQVRRYTFSATAGGSYALDLSGVTTTPTGQSVCVKIYTPNSGAITESGYYTYTCSTGSASVLNLHNLPTSGTYTAIVYANYALPASATLELISGEAVTQTTNGASEAYAANVAGENVYMSFTATQGQNLELTFNNVNVTGASYNAFGVTVYNAAGTTVSSFTCYNSNPAASCSQSLWNLAAGTYSVTVTPNWGGLIQFNAILQPDIVGPALTNGTAITVTLGAGQVERYTFSGTAGQALLLQLSGVATTPTGQNVTATVYAPNAGQITTANYYTYTNSSSGVSTLNFNSLPLSGTYTVVVSSAYGLPATAQLLLANGINAAQPANGTSETYSTSQSGQNIYETFTATQGENLELTLNNMTMTGSTQNSYYVDVYDTTTGNNVTSYWCYPSSPGASCSQSLWNLATGQYSITISADGNGTMSFNTILTPDITGPALVLGTPANVSLAAGQVERYTFAGTAGGTLALELSSVETTPAGQYVAVNVYRPDVGLITSGNYYTNTDSSGGDSTLNLSNLPVTGNYTVIVSSSGGLPASAQLSLVNGITGTQASSGTPVSYAASEAGQNVYFTFTATQGQNLELTFNNMSITGSTALYYSVYNSDGQNLVGYVCPTNDPGASCTQTLWNLSAGQYTVIVSSESAAGIVHFNAILQPDVVESPLTPGAVANVNLAAGQVQRYTFNGTLGSTMSLQFSGSSTSPTGQALYFSVYRPDVGEITTADAYVSGNTSLGPGTFNLANLPVSGTYTVVVQPSYGLASNGQLLLVNGITATQPTNGTSEPYQAKEIGQDIYFNFNATQGQNLELTLNNITETGNTTAGFNVVVTNPTGGTAASFTCYPSNANSCTQSLWNLSAGQYSVVVEPSSSSQLNFDAIVQPDVVGPTTVAGYPTNFTLNAGQAERITFNANVRDTVELQLTGTTVPAGQAVDVSIYRPDVGWITTQNAYTSTSSSGSTTTLTIPRMPAAGTYTAVITTKYGLPATATFGVEVDNTNAPPAYGTANLQANSTAQSEVAAGAGDDVTMTFNATQGQNLELALSNINVPGASSNEFGVAITDPWGDAVANYYCSAGSAGSTCNEQLWNLYQGTYTIVVTPNWGGTINFDATLTPDIIGPALTVGTPTTVNLDLGQVERYTFNGTLGGTLALELSGVSTTPANQNVYVTVYSPTGGLITPSDYYTYTYLSSNQATLNLTNLPATGTYTAIVYATNALPFTAQLELANGVTGTQPTNGTSTSYAATDGSQNVYFNFTATQGENLELTLNDVAVTGGLENQVNVNVYTSLGQQVASFQCGAGNPDGSCMESLWNLAAGTYTVVVEPSYYGKETFNAIISPNIVGPALTPGTPATISLGAGQAERFTFNGTLGGTATLALSDTTTTPAGSNIYLYVYSPNGGLIMPNGSYANTNTSGATTLNMDNLPATGTYTVVAYNNYGLPVTAQLALASGSMGTQPTNGTPVSYSTSVSGQNIYFTFTATPGQNLEFALNNLVLTGSSNNLFTATVYQNSDGAQINSVQCYNQSAGPQCSMPLWNLAPGTYTAVIAPETGGVMSFNAIVQPDIVGPALTPGTAVNLSLTAGQEERYTFNGTLGGNMALQLSNVTTTPAGQWVYVSVYKPTSGLITQYGYYAQGNTANGTPMTINLNNLPASGTYTVIVSASSDLPATAQLLLVNAATNSQPTNGTSESYTTTESGQNAYATFTATQGQNLEFTINNMQVTNTTSSSGEYTIYVYNAGGAEVNAVACYETYPGGSCSLSLWNLNAGTYTAIVTPLGGGEMQFDGVVTADVAGGALTAGTPVNVNLATGQVERYTFSGTLGSSVSLELSGVNTTPSGQSVTALVYSPTTGVITTSNYFTSTSGSSEATLNIPSLPATGTYTVIVYGGYGLPATAQLALSSDDTGTQSINDTSKAYAAKQPSQDIVFTFSATQNQNLELTLNNVSIPDGTNNNVQLSIVGPNGSNTSFYCSPSTPTSSCRTSLWNLQAGTYTVTASPESGGTMQFDAIVAPDISGPTLTANAPASISLAAGQSERLTFAGTVGGSADLELSNVTTSTGYVYVNVYAPNVGPITTSNYYTYTYAATGGTAALNLTNLPVSGTYTAVVYTQYGQAATAELSIASGASGTLSSTAESFAAGAVNQTVSTTFAATSGQNLELTLNNINASGGSTDGFEVVVTNPAGESVANFYCYGTTPGASCSQSLWNLAAGLYTVTATPIWGGVISFDAMIVSDVSGPTLTSGTATDITLNAGQVERVKFAGTAGDAATLQLTAVSTTPANQNVYVYVYLPTVGTIITNDAYEVFQATSSNTISIPSLPVTGTYTAIVTTSSGIPASAQMTYTQ